MAYALESLIQNLKQDQYLLNLDTKLQNQIKSLIKKASFLRDDVQKVSNCVVIPEYLESRTRDAVHEAEDAFDIHIRNQILSDGASELDLADVMEEFNSIGKEIMRLKNLKERDGVRWAHSLIPDDIVSRISLVSGFRKIRSMVSRALGSQKKVVGLARDVKLITDLLDTPLPALQIIPILGDGGIGKTTLAQELYKSTFVRNRFFQRAWITISQDYNVQTTLLDLLGCLRKVTNEMRKLKYDQLGELVYHTLKGKSYLIVVDDIWDVKAWDEIRRFFPHDDNRSRIILTTRNSTLAGHASSSGFAHQMCPMDGETSLELLSGEVHGHCQRGIEDVAKAIALKCRGSPLALTVIAGLLFQYKNKPNRQTFWLHIFISLSREVAKEDDINVAVSSVSYRYLSNCLKPCFLYLGAFPEDYEIRCSKIIKLWIVEGFVKSLANANLEDTAEVYLHTLIHRNLIMVSNNEPNCEGIKAFKVHDIVRDFCRKKSRKDKFLWSQEDLDGSNILGEEEKMRRVSARPLSKPSKEKEQLSLARSFLCIGRASLHLPPVSTCMRLLKVLYLFQVEFYQFPTEILQLVLLKLLAFSCHSPLPSSISKLRNLQTLVIRRLPSFRAFVLPSELWELPQLRHVESKATSVICYFPIDGENVQENLQTLLNVQMLGVTNEFLRKVPNLRKLGIFCSSSMPTVIDLACLHNLKTLKCSSDWSFASHNFLSYLTFPSSLRKLTLSFCKIHGGFMKIISSLPNLEDLKVQKSDFLEPVWVVGKGQFTELMSLHMEELNLVTWEVIRPSFQNLGSLVIRSCTSMTGIPSGIKHNGLTIDVDESSPSLLDSLY